MPNSTLTYSQVLTSLAAKGVPDPRRQASGFGDSLVFEIINDLLGDLITARFNFKWNRANAIPFATNSWQQDYPQIAQAAGPIGWGEDCDQVDINNTMNPKPLWNVTWRRNLSRLRTNLAPVRPGAWQISWMYNKDLSYGFWPGAGVTYYPLITTAQTQQNPIMSMIDANGNLLILTTFGTTGTAAPVLPASSVEGTTVSDGTCVWTVVDPWSQGFRLYPLPNATGPVYLILPYYQLKPPRITTLAATLDPIPDDYSRHFTQGLEFRCMMAQPDPKKKQEARQDYNLWLKAQEDELRQGDSEVNAYRLMPATSPVETIWPGPIRGTADQPY
jgi:hypothetical protein